VELYSLLLFVLFLLFVALVGGLALGLVLPWRWRLAVTALVGLVYAAIILPTAGWASLCSDCIVGEGDTREDMLWFAAYVLGFPAAFGIVTVWVSAGFRYALGALFGIRTARE
jgi:hypothetical protein